MVSEGRHGSGKSWGKGVKCLNMVHETLKNKCMFYIYIHIFIFIYMNTWSRCMKQESIFNFFKKEWKGKTTWWKQKQQYRKSLCSEFLESASYDSFVADSTLNLAYSRLIIFSFLKHTTILHTVKNTFTFLCSITDLQIQENSSEACSLMQPLNSDIYNTLKRTSGKGD